MKLAILAFSLLVFLPLESRAFVANCDFESDSRASILDPLENHALYGSSLDLKCRFIGQGDHESYTVLTTLGPGLQLIGREKVIITCPNVSYSRLIKVIRKRGSWQAIGASGSLSLGVGARAGVAFNHRGALCSITGVSVLGIGAAAGIVEISIE